MHGQDGEDLRVTLTAKAFESIDVILPQLRVGAHELTITARTGSGDSARTDRLTRSFVVVASRLTRSRTAHLDLTYPIHRGGADEQLPRDRGRPSPPAGRRVRPLPVRR